MDSCLVLTECLSRRILRFRTSAIDLIHSERVSASTSSFFAHRVAYSSHASMIMPKFCPRVVPWIWDRFPVFWALAQKISQFYNWDHLSQYGHMEHTVQKLWIRAVARWWDPGILIPYSSNMLLDQWYAYDLSPMFSAFLYINFMNF